MGIKHFFYWFKNNFGNNIKCLRSGQDFKTARVSIDNLMIDLNGLFHSSTQKIYEYGAHKPPVRLMGRQRRGRKRVNKLRQQIKVFENICLNIEDLLRLVNPNKRLILCVDGPAPLSKQNQQRQRRFRSAAEKDEEEFRKFDSNSLTPGTKFMHHLTKYIDWYIRKRITYDPIWQNIEVVFSNEKSPGEGEHKIINYIRLYGNPRDSYCIHGLDADLIMLALGTQYPKFWILREDLYDPQNEFFVIDIGNTRINLAQKMDWHDSDVGSDVDQKKQSFNPEYAINDFILMCFMVGNDFLPHVPSLEIIEGGIDFMLDVYKNVGDIYGHLTTKVDEKVKFIPRSLRIFLGTISQYDKGILQDKLLKKGVFFPDVLLEKHATLIEGKYELAIDNYREEYYQECFGENTDIRHLCHQYLEGIQWVLSYYTRGVPDWKWCFKHHYAPFAHELAEHIVDFKFSPERNTIPMTPFQQLLSVLPPKSAGLIPIPLSQLLLNKKSKIKQYCPDELIIDLSGKRKEWEGIVLLPMVDFKIIESEYFKHIDKVDRSESGRNILGKSFMYSYSHKCSFEFRSFYGNISNCRVVTRVIEI